MRRWLAGWVAILVMAAGGMGRAGDDPFEDAAAEAAKEATAEPGKEAAPPCFVIPSAEELGASDQIVQYREKFAPTLYQPEWAGWPWLDLGALAALLGLGSVMVWRHVHTRWFWIPAALTLWYFGFVRGGCICPVGSVANLSIGVAHPELVGISTALMFLLPLVVALFMGRVFCAAGCPLGAIQELLSGKKPVKVPERLERVLRWLPVGVLVATVWLAIRGGQMLVCLLDPYKTAFFWGYGWIQRLLAWAHGDLAEPGWFWIGDWSAWGILIASLLIGFRVYRPFCRFVCPYGVLLGWFSAVAFKRRHVEQDHCVLCGLCERKCPVQAITRDPETRQFSVSTYHCIQCNRCSSHCRKDGIG